MPHDCTVAARRSVLRSLTGLLVLPLLGCPGEGEAAADSGRLLVEFLLFAQQGAITPQASAVEPLTGTTAAGAEALAAKDWQLASLDARLRRHDHWRVLGHTACVVPVASGATATLRIEELLPGAGVTGHVTVTRGQYLYLHVDAVVSGDGLHQTALEERRRVKFGELHYFDGARLGAIAMVSPARGAPGAG